MAVAVGDAGLADGESTGEAPTGELAGLVGETSGEGVPMFPVDPGLAVPQATPETKSKQTTTDTLSIKIYPTRLA